MTSYLVRILIITAIFSLKNCEDVECEREFEEAEIIPTYVDEGTPGNLTVEYGADYSVNCGNELPILATINSPTVTYDVEEDCERITLLMFDPDSKGLPQFLHWLVMNIPVEIMRNGFDNGHGWQVEKYFLPGSQLGYHRYIFCIYCQKNYIRDIPSREIFRRIGFDPRKFADKYDLGNPIACNFFYSSLLKPEHQNVSFLRILSDATKKL